MSNEWKVEVVAVIGETDHASPETDVIHRPGIDSLPVGTELVDRAHVTRMQAEIERLTEQFKDWQASHHANYVKAAGERDTLRTLLSSMTSDYACSLEAGYDRITQLGGDCDSVQRMLSDNPSYAKAIAAISDTTAVKS